MTTEGCPYCRAEIAPEDAVAVCSGCGTKHHQDCYDENGGCTIFGCSCAPAEEPKLSVSAPDLAAIGPSATAPAEAQTPAVASPLPPPPPKRDPVPATTDELRQIANQVVPSMFGSFGSDATMSPLAPEPIAPTPPKNRTTFILLGALLGAFGAHNFYAGYRKKALGQLALTVLTLGFGSPMTWIWAIIDICTVNRDSSGVEFES
jgi:TM2 domain-containing membrane protein YozV